MPEKEKEDYYKDWESTPSYSPEIDLSQADSVLDGVKKRRLIEEQEGIDDKEPEQVAQVVADTTTELIVGPSGAPSDVSKEYLKQRGNFFYATERLTRIHQDALGEVLRGSLPSTRRALIEINADSPADPWVVDQTSRDLTKKLVDWEATSYQSLFRAIAGDEEAEQQILREVNIADGLDEKEANLIRKLFKKHIVENTEMLSEESLALVYREYLNKMNSLEPVSEDALAALMLTYGPSWETLMNGLSWGIAGEQKPTNWDAFAKDMKHVFGANWKRKTAGFLVLDAIEFAAASSITGGYLGGAKILKRANDLRRLAGAAARGREGLLRAGHSAIEFMTFGVIDSVVRNGWEGLYSDEGRRADIIKDNVKDILMLGGMGMAFGGLSYGVFGMSKGKAQRQVFDVAKQKAINVAEDTNPITYWNTTEKLSVLTNDAGVSSRLARAAHETAWGRGGQAMETTTEVGNPAGKFEGMLKEEPFGLVKPNGIGDSPSVSEGTTALAAAIENKQPRLTLITYKNKDGKLVYAADSLDSNAIGINTLESIVKKLVKVPGALRQAIRHLSSPSEMGDVGKIVVDDIRYFNAKEASVLNHDLKVLENIYKKFKKKRFWNIIKTERDRVERALADMNDVGEWFDDIRLAAEPYNLSERSIKIIKEDIIPFAERDWFRKNTYWSNVARERGMRAVLDDPLDEFGAQPLWRRLMSNKRIEKMSDVELSNHPLIKPLVERWEQSALGPELHPISQLRNGAELGAMYNIADGVHIVKDGLSVFIKHPNQLGDVTRPLTKRGGYFPVSYPDTTHSVFAVNPKTGETVNVFNANYSVTISRFMANNEEKFKNRGLYLFNIKKSEINNTNVAAQSPVEFLLNPEGLSPKKLEEIVGKMKDALGDDLSPEQVSLLYDNFVQQLAAPNLRMRSDIGVRGYSSKAREFAEEIVGLPINKLLPKGRKQLIKTKSGEYKYVFKPGKIQPLPSERSWQRNIANFDSYAMSGNWRNKMAESFVNQYGRLIKPINGNKEWWMPLDYPVNGRTPKDVADMANAQTVQDILKRQLHTPTFLEEKWMERLGRTTMGAAEYAVFKEQMAALDLQHAGRIPFSSVMSYMKNKSESVFFRTTSGLLEGLVDAKQTILNAKAVSATIVFAWNVGMIFPNAASGTLFSLSKQVGPLATPRQIKDMTALWLAQIPGIKLLPKVSKKIRLVNQEIKNSGLIADLKQHHHELGNLSKRMDSITFSSSWIGDGAARIAGFAAERNWMMDMYKKGRPWAQIWFTKNKKGDLTLTEDGMREIVPKAIRYAGDMKSRDVPALSRGFAGFLSQFVLNPATKELEKWTGKGFTRAQKIKALIWGSVLFGPQLDQIPLASDAIKYINWWAKGSPPESMDESWKKSMEDPFAETLVELGMSKESARSLSSGGVSELITGARVSIDWKRRMFFGQLYSELQDRAEYTNPIFMIPSLGIGKRTVEQVLDTTDVLTSIISSTKERGVAGEVASYFSSGEGNVSNAELYDQLVLSSTDIFPGGGKLIRALYSFGLNFEQERKWVDSKGFKIDEVEDMGFGDYLEVALGVGIQNREVKQELNELEVGAVWWAQRRAYDVARTAKHNPDKAAEMDEENKRLIKEANKPGLITHYEKEKIAIMIDDKHGREKGEFLEALQKIKSSAKALDVEYVFDLFNRFIKP